MGQRLTNLLKLSPAARRKLEALAKRHRLSVSSTVRRMIDWLSKQPELIQYAVLGRFKAPINHELAKLIIRAITKK